MRLVVTNDDGVHAPGLHELARHLVADGHDVTVVAPAQDHSGYGAALGPLHLSGRIEFERLALDALPGVDVVAVNGPPALCALSACLAGFGERPDILLSGINAGANTGRAVLHSGTVGAAFTANNFGVPSIAVSQAVGEVHHWSTAAVVATELVAVVAALGEICTLNVNVPNLEPQPMAVHVAMLATGGEVQTTMVEADGALQLQLRPAAPVPGTDSAVVEAGCVAITPLTPVTALEVPMQDAAARVEELLRSFGRDTRVA